MFFFFMVFFPLYFYHCGPNFWFSSFYLAKNCFPFFFHTPSLYCFHCRFFPFFLFFCFFFFWLRYAILFIVEIFLHVLVLFFYYCSFFRAMLFIAFFSSFFFLMLLRFLYKQNKFIIIILFLSVSLFPIQRAEKSFVLIKYLSCK